MAETTVQDALVAVAGAVRSRLDAIQDRVAAVESGPDVAAVQAALTLKPAPLPPGWVEVYMEDFDTPAPLGSLAAGQDWTPPVGSYYRGRVKLGVGGYPHSGPSGRYSPADTVSVEDGLLSIRCLSRAGEYLSGSVQVDMGWDVHTYPDGSPMARVSATVGSILLRYKIRAWGAPGWGFASLVMPDTMGAREWPLDGEADWVESAASEVPRWALHGTHHAPGSAPGEAGDTDKRPIRTEGVTLAGWHVVEIEVVGSRTGNAHTVYRLDGVEVARYEGAASLIPTAAGVDAGLKPSIQAGLSWEDQQPEGDGMVQVDWIQVAVREVKP